MPKGGTFPITLSFTILSQRFKFEKTFTVIKYPKLCHWKSRKFVLFAPHVINIRSRRRKKWGESKKNYLTAVCVLSTPDTAEALSSLMPALSA